MSNRMRAVLVLVLLAMAAFIAFVYTRVGTSQGVATIVAPSVDASSVAPDIDTSIVFAPGIPPGSQIDLEGRAAAIRTELKRNPMSSRLWVDLGTIFKIGGDSANAIAMWSYAAKLDFQNPMPHLSLGDLYTTLRQYDKADQEYRQALAIDPHQTAAYRGLFQLYSTTSYKPADSSAEAILKQGIQSNPQALDLQISLAEYYRAKNRTADAKAAYEVAIATATAQGQTDLVAQIKQHAGSILQ